MDADVVGLIEIENNAQAAVADLVSGLERQDGRWYVRLHRHRDDRDGCDKGGLHLQAGDGDAGW